jgi:hypothetical protein
LRESGIVACYVWYETKRCLTWNVQALEALRAVTFFAVHMRVTSQTIPDKLEVGTKPWSDQIVRVSELLGYN